MSRGQYEVQGTRMSHPTDGDWETLTRTNDPVAAVRAVHETEGTFWRRLLEDGQVVLARV